MIRANKGGPFTALIDWYIARKVRSSFRGVWLLGEFPTAPRGVLAYLNHTSWWDGFMAHQLAKSAGWNGFAMMEEENLARYRFHTRIGAFSVKRGDPRGAVQSIRYARGLLSTPGNAVIIFPEGELRPGQHAPGALQRGVEAIVKGTTAACVPIAIRYAFLEHELPDVLVCAGEPHDAGPLARFESGLSSAWQRIEKLTSTHGLRPLVEGRAGVRERWDRVRNSIAATTSAKP